MSKIITQISIASPCRQNWLTMDQQEGSRFCNSCQKSVIDFTTKTNLEIIDLLNNSTSSVCGRLTNKQLSELNNYTLSIPKHNSWLKYIGVLALGGSIFVQDAKALTVKPKIEVNSSVGKVILPKELTAKIHQVYGIVVDDNDQPMVGIYVTIENTKLFAITDKKGRYTIKLPINFDTNNRMLLVKGIDIQGRLKLNYSNEKQRNLVAETVYALMGEVMIVNKKRN